MSLNELHHWKEIWSAILIRTILSEMQKAEDIREMVRDLNIETVGVLNPKGGRCKENKFDPCSIEFCESF